MLNKKKLFITVAIVSMIVIIGVLLVIFKNDKKLTEKITIFNGKEEDGGAVIFKDSVIVQDDNGVIKKVEIASGEMSEANPLEKNDFADFAGLPKMGIDGSKETAQKFILVSNDEQKAIVVVAVYDLGAQPNAFDGLPPILSSSEHVCDIAEKQCQTSELLSQAYQGLDPELQKEYGGIWWQKWDSEKNRLFAHLTGEGVGNASPVYICDIKSRKCDKTEGFDSLKDGDQRAVVTAGMFSPSLSKFVMINQHDEPNQETGKAWELLLYASSDLSAPARSYDISVIIDRDENVAYDGVQAVAWSGDEKKIAIGTSRRIFLFDVESGGLSLAYIAPTNKEGEFYWDGSALSLTNNSRYIAFIDSEEYLSGGDDEEEDLQTAEAENSYINVLKKIDLESGNQVSAILQGPGLSFK